jgi:alpha-tubulin suppressor-like RCC1 family protein
VRAWLLVVACGCGRLGFDAQVDANGDAVGDGPVARCTFRDVDTGRDHTCAIDGNDNVFCWGRNDRGQVTGTPSGPKTLPTSVTLPAPAVQLAVGRDFTCARVQGDDVYCWGDNSYGQLGIGSTTPNPGVHKVDLGDETAVAIDAGTFHACVIRASDRSLMCWGHNQHLAVGTTPVDATLSTPQLLATTQTTVSLGLGHRHSCATYPNESVTCWGRGEYGQLGNGTLTDRQPTNAINLSGSNVASGGRHTCGIDTAGVLRCCGRNRDGELGRGTSDLNPHTDCAVVGSGYTAIASGAGGTCAIHDSGKLACWGDVAPADGTYDLFLTPHDSSITDAAKLSFSFYHACAIRQTGELVC